MRLDDDGIIDLNEASDDEIREALRNRTLKGLRVGITAKGRFLLERLGDERYCAPCGTLFWLVEGAADHRREVHPEQARFERAGRELDGIRP